MVGLQHRWVAVAFVLTAGYWLLFELLAAIFALGSAPGLTATGATTAATAGSFSAARLSSLRRSLEPITGAIAFFFAAIAVGVATPDEITPLDDRLRALDAALAYVGAAGIVLGAVGGAWWGTRGPAEVPRRLTMSLLSTVLVWGTVSIFLSIAALPAGLAGAEPAPWWMLSAAVTGTAGGAWIAQMLTPVRRFDSISTGAALAFAVSVLPIWGDLVIAAVGAPIVFCIAAVGARSGWAWAEWWRRRQQREADEPPIAVIVD